MILKAFDYKYFKELKEIRKRRIYFFNGCFDIIHLGHMKMINKIKKDMGLKNYAYLIAAINSDGSVDALKKSHPRIHDEQTRAEALLNLGVDCVIIFDDLTPKNIIMSLMPDVVYKGDEYQNKDYEEREFMVKANINVKYFNTINGYSTTNIYNKIKFHVINEVAAKVKEVGEQNASDI